MKINEIFKKVKTEELIFGSLTISTILMNESSGIPGMVCALLLAFYYVVFSWYIFPVEGEKQLMFSIITGIVYATCLVCIAIYSVKIYDRYFFFYLEGILLFLLILFLVTRKNWGITYRTLHFFRTITIILLNIYLYIFRLN
jgi:hypothetical protein